MAFDYPRVKCRCMDCDCSNQTYYGKCMKCSIGEHNAESEKHG